MAYVQVAELRENGELVGVVKGCIKCVGTRFGASYVRLGCILGLRVSPRHRYLSPPPSLPATYLDLFFKLAVFFMVNFLNKGTLLKMLICCKYHIEQLICPKTIMMLNLSSY